MCCHVSHTVRVLVPLDRRLCSILVNTGRALVRRPKYFEISGNIGFCGKARGLAPKGGVACLAKQKQELQSVKWSRTVCSIPVPNIDFTNSLSPGAERCGRIAMLQRLPQSMWQFAWRYHPVCLILADFIKDIFAECHWCHIPPKQIRTSDDTLWLYTYIVSRLLPSPGILFIAKCWLHFQKGIQQVFVITIIQITAISWLPVWSFGRQLAPSLRFGKRWNSKTYTVLYM